MFLKKKGHNVFIGTSRKEMLSQALDGFNVVLTDWKNKKSLKNICLDIDIIIHATGMNAKDCQLDPARAMKVNGLYTEKLISAAVTMNVKKFIYLSTAHVYCSPLVGKINEDDFPKNPHPYATSHLAGENAVFNKVNEKKIEGYVLRIANAFGAPISKQTNCWSLVIQDFCKQIVEKEKILINSNFNIQRNFIPINAVCEIINNIIKIKKSSYKIRPINVGSEMSNTIKEMADLIKSVKDKYPKG